MRLWLRDSFKKVTCKVIEQELEEAKAAGKYIEITESSLGGILTAVAFCPRLEGFPEYFKQYTLYK